MNNAPKKKGASHILPSGYLAFQRRFIVLAIIAMDTYFLFVFFSNGLIPHTLNNYFDLAEAILGIIASAMIGIAFGGVSIGNAANFAQGIYAREWTKIFASGLGIIIFESIEFWASIVERSQNTSMNLADHMVYQLIGWNIPITPTVMIIALIMPVIKIFIGFVEMEPPELTTEELQRKQALELMQAQHKAQMAQYSGAAFGGGLGSALQAAGFRKAKALPPPTVEGSLEESPEEDGYGEPSGPSVPLRNEVVKLDELLLIYQRGTPPKKRKISNVRSLREWAIREQIPALPRAKKSDPWQFDLAELAKHTDFRGPIQHYWKQQDQKRQRDQVSDDSGPLGVPPAFVRAMSEQG